MSHPDIADLYRSAVLDHNRNPRNFGEMGDATASARGLNALCGDDITVYLRLTGGVIDSAGFSGEAGAITMASASMMTEALAGRTATEAMALKSSLACLLRAQPGAEDLREELGELSALEGVRRYPSRIRAALLPWEAMEAALEGRDLASTE